MSETAGDFAAIAAVGPGANELLRLQDLLAQLSTYESDRFAELVLVDDSKGAHDWSVLRPPQRVRVIPAKRSGRGDSWRGGLATNILWGIEEGFRDPRVKFIVKLDTDSFVIAPFANKISQQFEANRNAGVLGSCFEIDLHEQRVPSSTWERNIVKYAKLIRFRRRPMPRLETALFGKNRVIRRLISMALAHNWASGACAQGGGYAVCRELFIRWKEHGFLNEPLLWLETDLGEDVVVALLCFAAGREILDFNRPGEVFGVQYCGLGFAPEELSRRGYSIVHSVKSECWDSEVRIRDALRASARAAIKNV